MFSKLVLGIEPWLSMACDDWKCAEPSVSLVPIEVSLDNNYLFNCDVLSEHSPSVCTGFVAWGPDFLNFQRLELMGELKKRGFKMPALVHPSAVVSSSVKYQENTWIQAMAVVGANASIGLNSCIEIGARIGVQSIIEKSVWIGCDAKIGAFTKIGAHSVIGRGVEVIDSLAVGRQALIERTQIITQNWPDKKFSVFSSNLDGVIADLT